jgi:hypothetical protein
LPMCAKSTLRKMRSRRSASAALVIDMVRLG